MDGNAEQQADHERATSQAYHLANQVPTVLKPALGSQPDDAQMIRLCNAIVIAGLLLGIAVHASHEGNLVVQLGDGGCEEGSYKSMDAQANEVCVPCAAGKFFSAGGNKFCEGAI